MDFPFITKLRVNDCYAQQNFEINADTSDGRFRHILLTGKNGSGKTTILTRTAHVLAAIKRGENPLGKAESYRTNLLRANPSSPAAAKWSRLLKELDDVHLEFNHSGDLKRLIDGKPDYILAFFKAHRRVEVETVDTVTTENAFTDAVKENQDHEQFAKRFKQYLVNKKVYEAFDFIDHRTSEINRSRDFFHVFESTLREIFHDKHLMLKFRREDFEFLLEFTDGREITFNQLSEGFSAFLSILMDLFMRVDILRKLNQDFSFDPAGFVLIDEPETHFHIEMQYEILPLFTRLFPRLQLLVATHSPAVISSLKDSVVYDLSSGEQDADWLLGSSYSELMVNHFGLDNEFSPIADRIIGEIDRAVKEENLDLLRSTLIANERYLTPSLRLEIESQLVSLERKLIGND